MFQAKVEAWLSRSTPNRAFTQCYEIPVVLSTDIGLIRTENQDRVAALRIGTINQEGRPFLAVAVADGMGGMREGGRCASIAVSSFFYALLLHRREALPQRAIIAIEHANNAVFKFAEGRGGATLSAVLFDQDSVPLIVHVGDTRVYSLGLDTKLKRLTVDDSLAEAVGGYSRDLLQFAGMGPGIQPQVYSLASEVGALAITSDGLHSVHHETMEQILSRAPDPRIATERLAALARWSGGDDNASCAFIDMSTIKTSMSVQADGSVQLWDASGSLIFSWMRGEAPGTEDASASPTGSQHPDGAVSRPKRSRSGPRTRRKQPEAAKRQTRRAESDDEGLQLDIAIERSQTADRKSEG